MIPLYTYTVIASTIIVYRDTPPVLPPVPPHAIGIIDRLVVYRFVKIVDVRER